MRSGAEDRTSWALRRVHHKIRGKVYDTARARKPPCGRAAPRPFPALEERAESPAERRAAV